MKTKEQIYDELSQELGIPLEVLFKALKNGIYYKGYPSSPYIYYAEVDLRCCNDDWRLLRSDSDSYFLDSYFPKDYGKTWAITKEELE